MGYASNVMQAANVTAYSAVLPQCRSSIAISVQPARSPHPLFKPCCHPDLTSNALGPTPQGTAAAKRHVLHCMSKTRMTPLQLHSKDVRTHIYVWQQESVDGSSDDARRDHAWKQ